jgi:hypothetical protein
MLLLCFNRLIGILAINYIFYYLCFCRVIFSFILFVTFNMTTRTIQKCIIWMIGILATDDDLLFFFSYIISFIMYVTIIVLEERNVI